MYGERFEKSTPASRLFFPGLYVLAPITLGLVVFLFKNHHVDGVFEIWAIITVMLIIQIFGSLFWVRCVPNRVSYILGTFVWIAAFWLALHANYDF
jgi:hypothetical protein